MTTEVAVQENEVPVELQTGVLTLPEENFKFRYLIGTEKNELSTGIYEINIKVPKTFEEFDDCFGRYYVPIIVSRNNVSIPVVLDEEQVTKYGLVLIGRAVNSYTHTLCKLNGLSDLTFRVGSVSRITSTVLREWKAFVNPIYHTLERNISGSGTEFFISNCYQTLTAPNAIYHDYVDTDTDTYLSGTTLPEVEGVKIEKTFTEIRVLDVAAELMPPTEEK